MRSCARVYPRVCGGTTTCTRLGGLLAGLSPRVRGNRHLKRCGVLRGGSIPACAGEPRGRCSRRRGRRVYPRVCGGTSYSAFPRKPGWGLSPRVRGNRTQRPTGRTLDGSIPACAGEPCGCSRCWCQPRVYPRVCGGTSNRASDPSAPRGLSPRVRGNLYSITP